MSRSAFTLDSGKISNRQLMFIIIATIISTADIFLPAIVAAIAGRDAWISVLLATVEALVMAAIIISLGLRFSDKTLVEICQLVLGRWIGWILAFSWVTLFSVNVTINVLGQLSIIIKAAFMQATPQGTFIVILAVIAAYAVNQGLETIARVTELLLPLGIGLLVLVGVLVLPLVEFGNYLPVMSGGLAPVVNGAHRMVSFLGEGVIILMLMPYLNQPQKVVGAAVGATALLGAFLFIGVLAIGMFNVTQTANMIFPALEMIRMVQIGQFFQHLDAIIMTVWIAGIYIKIVVYFYISCIGYAQLFGVKSYRTLIIPFGCLVAASGLIWINNVTDVIQYLYMAWPTQGLLFELLVPLLLLLVAVARGLRSTHADDHQKN